MKYIPEPFKIKMVEPIAMTSREERANILARAHYNCSAYPPSPSTSTCSPIPVPAR